MRPFTRVLLFFFLIISCHSPGSRKEVQQAGETGHLPFDVHSRLVFTRHARCRMDCRHITSKEIQEILDEGHINYSKSEPEGKPDPKWAVEGYTAEQQHLRIVVAPEPDKLVIITCIELGVEWSCHCN
jgi:hypothetical protein